MMGGLLWLHLLVSPLAVNEWMTVGHFNAGRGVHCRAMSLSQGNGRPLVAPRRAVPYKGWEGARI